MVKFFFFIIFLISFTFKSFAEIRSLKNNKVNVRLGPSKNYPVKFVYKKKYLPVLVLDEHYNWRKIKDYENDNGWVHISQLSKLRTSITIKDDAVIFTKPSIYSKPKVKLEIYQTLILNKCNQNWCNVKNSKTHGWIKKNILWQVKKSEIFE
jgi:SH3-like domain-containing protein